MAAINDNVFELVQHSPYSSDLAQLDFHLIPKKLLKTIAIFGTLFWSDDDILHAVEDLLNTQRMGPLKVALGSLNIADTEHTG